MTDPRLQALQELLDIALLVLARPAVQRQLIAFLLVFLASWLLPEPLGGLLSRLLRRQSAISQRRRELGLPPNEWRVRLLRWARGLQLLIFPVVGLLASELMVRYFAAQGWRNGLLKPLASVFWLILGYRLVGGLLFGELAPKTAATYQRRFVTPIFLILTVVVVGAGVGNAFSIFDIVLFTMLDTPITVRLLALAAVVFYGFLAVSWIVSDVLQAVVFPRVQADPGVANTVLVTARYTIITLGIVATLATLGVNLTALAIVGGGLSVGIGFGLQELVANFISGILLLFDRTLRPGDIVEVGGQRGTVSQLRMRATVLRTADNARIVVPNKTLLTSTIATYTQTNRVVRQTLRVGVAYGSDPTLVHSVLQRVIDSHGVVLKDPAPAVYFSDFGESSLVFEIAVWLANPLRAMEVLSDLRFMIYREFAKAEIEIPFPQLGLHLRDGASASAALSAESDAAVPAGSATADRPKPSVPKPDLPG